MSRLRCAVSGEEALLVIHRCGLREKNLRLYDEPPRTRSSLSVGDRTELYLFTSVRTRVQSAETLRAAAWLRVPTRENPLNAPLATLLSRICRRSA